MPVTVDVTINENRLDGKTSRHSGFRDMSETTISWGAGSSTSWGLEPVFIFTGIAIPRGRHIVSAFPYYSPSATRAGTNNSPVGYVTVENNPQQPDFPSGVSASQLYNRNYFPSLLAPMFPWNQNEEIQSAEITRYIQELVLNPLWIESNNNVLVRLTDPADWTGTQKIVAVYGLEHATGNPARLVIKYSDRSVASIETRRYPIVTPTNNRQSWYHAYRIRLDRTITLSGLWGGATTSTNFALWNDNNGVPGAVVTEVIGAANYGVNRVNPVVLSPGWYWLGSGAATSHTTVAGISTLNRASLISANPAIAEIQPSSGIYQASSSTLGAPSVFTGASVSTVAREYAYGIDYIEGDHNIDDVTPPTIHASIRGG